MLTMRIKNELFNPTTSEFIEIDKTFRFEHSLKSVAKWEAKYRKPFLVETPHTAPELMDYYSCMCLDSGFKLIYLNQDSVDKLNKYISESQTATKVTFNDHSRSGSYVSSEVLYASMAMAGVPFEADRWHLSRLMALLGVISVKSDNGKTNKMSRAEVLEQNRALNEQRRRELGSKG